MADHRHGHRVRHLPSTACPFTAGAVTAALLAVVAMGAAPAAAKEKRSRVLLYTGTTGYRHADAINSGRPVIQAALEQAGYAVNWEDCTDDEGNPGNCDHPTENPRVFSKHNLKRYDALLLFTASASPVDGRAAAALRVR